MSYIMRHAMSDWEDIKMRTLAACSTSDSQSGSVRLFLMRNEMKLAGVGKAEQNGRHAEKTVADLKLRWIH